MLWLPQTEPQSPHQLRRQQGPARTTQFGMTSVSDSIHTVRPSRGAWGTGRLRGSRTHGPQAHPKSQGKKGAQGCAAKCPILQLWREQSATWQPAQDSALQTPSDPQTSLALGVNTPCPGQSSLHHSGRVGGKGTNMRLPPPCSASLPGQREKRQWADHTPGWPTHATDGRTPFQNAGPQALGSYAHLA